MRDNTFGPITSSLKTWGGMVVLECNDGRETARMTTYPTRMREMIFALGTKTLARLRSDAPMSLIFPTGHRVTMAASECEKLVQYLGDEMRDLFPTLSDHIEVSGRPM